VFQFINLLIYFIFIFHNITSSTFDENVVISNLKCEYLSSPNNIDTFNPRFSWILESSERGQYQTAYQILVSTNESYLDIIWDSGKIISSETSQIIYEGIKLKSNSNYFWKVQIWDRDSLRYESEIEEFWTSILDSTVWMADWIGANPKIEYFPEQGFFQSFKEQYNLPDTIMHEGRSLLLRNEFKCSNSIKNARVFVTGLGFYELFMNGKKIGNHVLAPAKTNYREEVLYDTYDITQILKVGNNAIGIHLGNGWFNPYKKWWRPYRMQWFGAKRAYLQLHIEYENGKKEIVTTNEDWKTAPGPILFNCIYDGEVYDANAEYNDWTEIGYDASKWSKSYIVKSPGGKLISHTMPPVRITKEINPIKEYKPSANVIVYDMGQNFTGWLKVKVKGKKGTKLHLQFAEDINNDGSINTTSNEHAKAEAVYILKGDGQETYEPRFTYFGFKYVEVTSDDEMPIIEELVGLVTHTDIKNTGKFICGNETINKIHNATIWSQRSNIIGYPMDCPQRDERLGWFGDVQVTIEEALFNFDTPQFYKNWLSGIQSNQNQETGDIPIISPRPYIWDEGVEWSSTYIILVWKFYTYYGDKQILAQHYPAMKKYMNFLESISENYILKKGWIGDWGSLVERWNEGEPESVPTAFYYWNSKILSKIAIVLEEKDDELFFSELSNQIKSVYNQKFYDPEKRDYNDGSQMANAFPLYLGIVPENDRDAVLQNLVDDIVINNNGHLTTGVLGSKYMIDALCDRGREDVAYLLATQTGYPSWSDMVEKYTTMCEFWTLKQSHNHIMTGSIDAFFYKTLAGINFNEDYPGCKQLIIKPYFPANLNFVKASIETINGKVNSSWEKIPEGLKVNVKIPVNVTAEIHLPTIEKSKLFEGENLANNSLGVEYIGRESTYSKFIVQSGEYKFIVKY
jgi:alpha-L-rhamnosidase